MSFMTCPHCQQQNRSGARFCTSCGRDMQTNAPHMGHKAAQVASQAAHAAAPVIQQAAAAGWTQSKRSMGWLQRTLTLGGKAAYTELFNPEPVLSGWVLNSPQVRTIQAPIEGAFLFFLFVLLFSWLILFLKEALWIGVILAAWFVLLLILNFADIKRPFFTTMTWQRLLGRLLHIQVIEFYMQEMNSNRQLRVEMAGIKQPFTANPGTFIQVYGIEHQAQTIAHAWWITAISPDGQTQTSFHAPRLIPLSVALFLPFFLTLLIWAIRLIWLWSAAPRF